MCVLVTRFSVHCFYRTYLIALFPSDCEIYSLLKIYCVHLFYFFELLSIFFSSGFLFHLNCER